MFKWVVGGYSFDLGEDFVDFRAYLDEQNWFLKNPNEKYHPEKNLDAWGKIYIFPKRAIRTQGSSIAPFADRKELLRTAKG